MTLVFPHLLIIVLKSILACSPSVDAECSHPNLVLNPSFENAHFCPYLNSMEERDTFSCEGWLANGTVDHYLPCGNDHFSSVPNEYHGEIEPKDGDGFVGLVLIAETGLAESMEGQLISPLKKGQRYSVSFWARTTKYSPYFTNSLGIKLFQRKEGYFERRTKWRKIDGSLISLEKDVPADVRWSPDRFFDSLKWVHISDTIVAEGGENAITIGGFWFDLSSENSLFTKDPEKLFIRDKFKYLEKYLLKKNPFVEKHEEGNRIKSFRIDQKDSYYFIDNVEVKRVCDK